jgi:NADPH:quinone reductase-like Zn-dependent oxidoreductase
MLVYQLDLSKKGFAAIQRVERPTPKPVPGEVLVRMYAWSLNFRDLLIINGLYPVATGAKEIIPVCDGTGEVVEIGAGVTRFAKGDRVVTTFFQGWIDGPLTYPAMGTALGGAVNGVLAEYSALSEQGLVKMPQSLSYEAAATLPCAGVTAWHALIETGHLRSGQTVLALGTGGVSIIGLQLAKAKGARVIITSSSDEKLARAKSLGADLVVNYKKTPDWDEEVIRLTSGTGADHVLETGGAGTFQKSAKALSIHGQINIIGVLTGLQNNLDLTPVLVKVARVQGIYVGSRAMLERLVQEVVSKRIAPVVDKVFPFDKAVEAYQYLASGQHFGKVVIRRD